MQVVHTIFKLPGDKFLRGPLARTELTTGRPYNSVPTFFRENAGCLTGNPGYTRTFSPHLGNWSRKAGHIAARVGMCLSLLRLRLSRGAAEQPEPTLTGHGEGRRSQSRKGRKGFIFRHLGCLNLPLTNGRLVSYTRRRKKKHPQLPA